MEDVIRIKGGRKLNGEVTVSNAIDAMPATSITVNDAGSIK